jgi:hypothetical protein
MTRFIVRLRPWWLRVPLWSVWYIVAAAGVLITAAWSYPHRLLVADFWRTMWAAYLIGIDGI